MCTPEPLNVTPMPYFDDPSADPRLHAIPDFIRNQIVTVADTALKAGHRPTPSLVMDVLERLQIPAEPEWVVVTLMAHWRYRLDELDPTDSKALRSHLACIPVRSHPWCFYVEGLVTGLELPGRRFESGQSSASSETEGVTA